jgi:hypothetical protein
MLGSRLPGGVLLLLGSLWAQGVEVAVAQDKAGAPPAQAVQPSAAAPVPHPVDARTLGMAEALLDYCAKNDAASAAKVRARLKQVTQGAGKQALAAARMSREYRTAHDSEAAFVAKVDARNAHRLCSQSPAEGK